MTRDEIFSNELEYLYFRLVAARNALNETNDPDTEHCLYDILTQTLDKIERKGSDEDRAAASEIVVRKSNKYARYILTNQKLVLLATVGAVLIGAGALFGIIMILIGGESKLKPSLILGGVAAVVISALVVIIKIKKGRMDVAREHLKGKTVIGARINTLTSKELAVRDSDKSVRSRGDQPKVVHNFRGVFVFALVVVILLIGFFVVKTKGGDIVRSAKILMVNIGLNPNKPEYSYDNYVELSDKLQRTHDKLCYDKALELISKKDYTSAYETLKEIPIKSNYGDAEAKKKEITGYIKYEEAMKTAATSLYEAAPALAEVPSDLPEIGEKADYYKTLNSTRGTYDNGATTFVIRDFVVDGDKVYLVEDSRGKLEIVKNDRPGAIYKALEKSSGNEISWYVYEDKVTRQLDASMSDLKKK